MNCIRIELFYRWNETPLWLSPGMPRILVLTPAQDKHGMRSLMIYNLLFKYETPLETPCTACYILEEYTDLWFIPGLTGYAD